MLIYAVSLAIVVLDRFTKFLALKFLSSHSSVPVVTNIFHLTLVKNSGIAFGFFQDRTPVLIIIVILCLVGLIFLSFRMRTAGWVERMSLAFILGGATSNLMDRFLFGYVIDFLDFRIWPVFNLADSFITVGVFLFLLSTLRKRL